jgi:hypothetical protein
MLQTLLLLSLAATATITINCGGCLEEPAARQAARRTLLEYASREKVDAEAFGEPEVRFQEPDRVWMFNYENVQNRHSVTITIGCGGRIETSRQIDN